MAAAPGLTLAELAARWGRSEEATLELLGPLLEAGLVAWRGGRLVVADRLVAAAFAQPEGPLEPAEEGPLYARVAAYLERHRGSPHRRRTTAIAAAVRGDKDRLRELLREQPEFVDEGHGHAHCWALTAWSEQEPAA